MVVIVVSSDAVEEVACMPSMAGAHHIVDVTDAVAVAAHASD
jgi:hypothetical protein